MKGGGSGMEGSEVGNEGEKEWEEGKGREGMRKEWEEGKGREGRGENVRRK